MSDYCEECGSSDPQDLGHGERSICCDAPIAQARFRVSAKPSRFHEEDDQ